QENVGYLTSVLQALNIPPESQLVVFSPTSSQARLINEEDPRAIYFNDDVSVGWVRGGEALEIAAHDPDEGVVFYTLTQSEATTPEFKRADACLSCHRSNDTLNIPGLLVRSTIDAGTRSFTTDHRSPFDERWGGWYVTGLARRFRHRGNRVGQGWLESLYDQFDTTGFPTMYSDIVALIVL